MRHTEVIVRKVLSMHHGMLRMEVYWLRMPQQRQKLLAWAGESTQAHAAEGMHLRPAEP
jgi:hypothetical protein